MGRESGRGSKRAEGPGRGETRVPDPKAPCFLSPSTAQHPCPPILSSPLSLKAPPSPGLGAGCVHGFSGSELCAPVCVYQGCFQSPPPPAPAWAARPVPYTLPLRALQTLLPSLPSLAAWPTWRSPLLGPPRRAALKGSSCLGRAGRRASVGKGGSAILGSGTALSESGWAGRRALALAPL